MSSVSQDPSPSGYVWDRTLGYGFPRYGTQSEHPLVAQGSQVKLVANLVAGGAISELWWNGKQFVNDHDYGRQIQIAANLSGQAEAFNPTEGGDSFGPPGEKGEYD